MIKEIAIYQFGDNPFNKIKTCQHGDTIFTAYFQNMPFGAGTNEKEALDIARGNLARYFKQSAREQRKSADNCEELAFSLESREFLVKINTNKGKTLEETQ